MFCTLEVNVLEVIRSSLKKMGMPSELELEDLAPLPMLPLTHLPAHFRLVGDPHVLYLFLMHHPDVLNQLSDQLGSRVEILLAVDCQPELVILPRP